jgi:hypothetical protein
MVIGKDPVTDSVHHLFVTDGKELPFSNLFDALYLLWSDVYLLVGTNPQTCGFDVTIDPPNQEHQ